MFLKHGWVKKGRRVEDEEEMDIGVGGNRDNGNDAE